MEKMVFRQVVSLGPNCRSKHQMKNAFGWTAGPRLVFDWQVTPPYTILDYVRSDFVGLFERADLEIVSGTVRNRRFGSTHQHDFPEGLTPSGLDARYAEARVLYDLLCDRTRRALDYSGPTLFVLARPIPDDLLRKLERLIGKRRHFKPFRILPGPGGDSEKRWTGDDELWTRHLSPYAIEPSLKGRLAYWYHQRQKRRGGAPQSISDVPRPIAPEAAI